MSEEFDKERQDLLDRFKESLRANADDYFFDEDDLIEIFDFAGDMNNDYLRAEALMRAARYYPDSNAMRQRRITFYADVLDPMMTEGLVENCADDASLLTQIAILRTSCSSKELVQSGLETFIEQYPPFDDEETIRFISLANDYKLLNWVYQNYERIAAHVQNEDILLYELGLDFYDTYSEERDFDRAAELLERLVQRKPFVADYWQILARSQYFSENHQDNYAESLDLALALNPQHKESLLFKVEIIDNDLSANENKDTLIEICNIYPDEQLPLALLLTTMNNEELRTDGFSRLVLFLEANPDSGYAISELLSIDPQRAIEQFEASKKQIFEIAEEKGIWTKVLRVLVFGNADAARHTMDYVLNKYLNKTDFIDIEFITAAIESTFYLQDFHRMFLILKTFTAKYETPPAVILLVALAHAKMGNIVEAHNFAKLYIRMDVNSGEHMMGWSAMNRLFDIGAKHLMEDLLQRTDDSVQERFDPTQYNPYGIWTPSSFNPKIDRNFYDENPRADGPF